LNAVGVDEIEVFCQNISNQDIDFEVPSFIPYKNEIFNFYILEENFNGSLILEEKKITSIKCTENQKPTYNIYIDKFQTLEEIQNSQDPLNLYNEKLKNKQIEIKGTTFGKKIKLAFTKITLKVVSWFK
ncbi:hypothetical protein ACFLZF_00135, partial [Nanoarchaeota archaeon]